MDNIIKIIESLEKSGLLIDGATETVKLQIKKQVSGFLAAIMPHFDASVTAPVTPWLINTVTERGVRSAGKKQKGGFILLLALPLMTKFLRNGVMDKHFQSHSIL